MPMAENNYLLHSVRNAMKILRLFSAERPELGITEISQLLDLRKSTAHRLVKILTEHGFMEKTEKGSKYQLGLAILGLSGVITTNEEILKESVAILENLVDQLGEAAHVSVLEGTDIVYLHKVECRHPVRLLSYIGRRNPAFCTSSGQVLLAYLKEDMLDASLPQELHPLGPNTITDKDALKRKLAEIRKQGFSIAVEELHEGAVSMAVPVRDFTGEVVAAITMVGPTQRIQENQYDTYIDILKKAGEKLTRQLGG
jgi:DNA-binding IclR family transcriptional regulator